MVGLAIWLSKMQKMAIQMSNNLTTIAVGETVVVSPRLLAGKIFRLLYSNNLKISCCRNAETHKRAACLRTLRLNRLPVGRQGTGDRGRSPLPDRRQAGGWRFCRGDRPRSPVFPFRFSLSIGRCPFAPTFLTRPPTGRQIKIKSPYYLFALFLL